MMWWAVQEIQKFRGSKDLETPESLKTKFYGGLKKREAKMSQLADVLMKRDDTNDINVVAGLLHVKAVLRLILT